jgi:hypothetical protein
MEMKNEGLQYTFRTLSKEDFDREFPDETLEQTNPETDVDTDNDPDEDGDGKETTADALRKAFERVAKGQTVRPNIEITDRKVTAPVPAPEAAKPYSQESAATVLAAAIQRARDKAQESRS